MIYSISNKIVGYLEREDVLNGEKEIYIYGAKLFISTFLGTVILGLIGYLSNRIIEAIFFEIIISNSRKIMGGYHSKSYVGCIVIYNLIFILDLFISENIKINGAVLLIIEIVGFLITFSICPIDNVSKKNSIKKKKHFKKLSIMFITVFIIVLNYLFIQDNRYVQFLITVFINIQILSIGGRLMLL